MKQITKLLLGLTALSLSYCAHDEEVSETRDITIPFAAKVGSETFDCNASYTGIGAKSGGGSPIAPRDFRFYVHNVELLTDKNETLKVELIQDGQWQYQNVALLDFENGSGTCANTSGPTPATNTVVQGSYKTKQGKINRIRFTVGVPDKLNHNDRAAAPDPLNIAALHWNWTTGYKHARLDFTSTDFADTTNTLGTFNIHLGATSCTGDGASGTANCAVKNRPTITLNYTVGQTIVADLKNLLATTDLSVKDKNGPKGCMSALTDPECKEIFNNLGLDFHFDPNNTVPAAKKRGLTSGTEYATSGQTFFRVE